MADKKVEKKAKEKVDQVNLIKLEIPYGGAPSNFKTIPAGVWRENDPMLLGLGGYLVSSKHATIAGKADPYPEAPVEEDEDDDEGENAPANPPPPADNSLLVPPKA